MQAKADMKGLRHEGACHAPAAPAPYLEEEQAAPAEEAAPPSAEEAAPSGKSLC